MNIEQWKKLHKSLDNDYNRFSNHYSIYKMGKNKQIRSNAEREFEAAIHSAVWTIKEYQELLNLFTNDNTDFGIAIAFDEIKNPVYFKQDLPSLMDKIRLIIEKLESENSK